MLKPRPRDFALLVIVILVIWRVTYHSMYLVEVPFSLATFSDGRQYELAAVDLLDHAPFGTKPFYLQGIYAYFMAIPMAIEPWVSLVLLSQLLLAGATVYVFYRTATHELGPEIAPWATATLLAYPMLAFYENKFLTAQLTITACVLVFAAASWARRGPGLARPLVLGAAVGLAILARPNMTLLVPFAIWSVVAIARGNKGSVGKNLGALALGLLVTLGPMAARNATVTGQVTIFPAHGGGTSFYIGNNAHARGVWNSAGGFISGDVSHERGEMRRKLGVAPGPEAQEVAAIGRALYAKAWREITDDPLRWAWLELRKFWLMVGSDELTQDYDLYGEQEMVPLNHRLGVPFGVLAVLGLLGGWVWRRRARGDPGRWQPVGVLLLGVVVATVAGNLLYFTSSQHRLPLAVPAAFVAPLAILWLRAAVERSRFVVVGVFVLAVALTFVPRRRTYEPTAVHYYNVAIAWLAIDQPHRAREALDEAVHRRPDHAVIRLQRARLRREFGHWQLARQDLAAIDELPTVPHWVRESVVQERRRLGTYGL